MIRVPFPSTDENAEVGVEDKSIGSHISVQSAAPELNVSVASSDNTHSHGTTSSSKLTSSDKLSALPMSSVPSPNASRIARPTNFALSNIKRGYRHSLDSPSSLSAITAGQFDGQSYELSRPRELSPSRFIEDLPSIIQRTHATDHSSFGKETPRQRVSFDSDRSSLPTMRSVGQAFSHLTTRGSDPQVYSAATNSPSPLNRRQDDASESDIQPLNSRSRSRSKSRAASPLRMLQNWSSNLHRGRTTSEERFIPVDPYKIKGHFPFCCTSEHRQQDIESGDTYSSNAAYDCDDLIPVNTLRDFAKDVQVFATDIFPRELYLNFLLRLPAMYFSRVARIYEDADVSRPDIQRMIDNSGSTWPRSVSTAQSPSTAHGSPPMTTVGGMLAPGIVSGLGLSTQVTVAPAAAMMHMPLPFPDEWTPPVVSPALIRFKHSWEAFIDSLLREWKTLNLVSALLASAILTVFQIPEAANDPLTRTFALLSLICALMSLSYGCIYIVRFGTMRSMFHASRWAEEARKTNTSIWWNVWVLLATPAVWMAWAMLLFISAILSFVWRTGSVDDPTDRTPLDSQTALAPRIVITSVLLLGIIYLGMIISTLKKYGDHQKTAHEIMHPHLTIPGTTAEVGRSRPVARNSMYTSKFQQKNNDVEMEHRGRERERSASVHVRRREEDPDSQGRRRRKSKESANPKNAGSKDALGFRFTSHPNSQQDITDRDNLDLDIDLKGPLEVNVSEVQPLR